MKLDHQKLEDAYIAKINQICDDCEDKEHFSIPEIISIIAELIDSGQFYLPPNSPISELIATRKKLLHEWSPETEEFFDELYSRLEWAETEAEVFNLRLKGEWTTGSRLYTKKELDDETNEAYNAGYRDGKENFYGENRDGHFVR